MGWCGIILLLLVFIICKYPDLSLPYFWDEAGVYAPGALRMKDTGIGLLPGALEPVYSRGHPLLCYAIFATGFKLLGDSVLVAHAIALAIACLTLVTCFLFVKEVFDPLTGLVTALLLSVQPLFYAMSGVVLPEMMLTLFTLLSVWGLVTSRWWLYLLGACLAVLTKEAGLVLPATAFVGQLCLAVTQKDFFSRARWRLLLIAAAPLLLFLVFIAIQRWQYGWYFFPLHTELMPRSAAKIVHKFLVILHMLFREQGRTLWPLWLAVFLLVQRYQQAGRPLIKRTWSVIAVCISLFILFSATNYYLHRYLLPVFPLLVLPVAYLPVRLSQRFPAVFRYGLPGLFTAVMLYNGIRHLDAGHFSDTNDMSYRQLVLCQQDCVQWVAQQPWSDSLIMVNFPVNTALADDRMGYLPKGKKINYTADLTARVTYAVFYMQDGAAPQLATGYRIIRRFQRRDAVFIVVKF